MTLSHVARLAGLVRDRAACLDSLAPAVFLVAPAGFQVAPAGFQVDPVEFPAGQVAPAAFRVVLVEFPVEFRANPVVLAVAD